VDSLELSVDEQVRASSFIYERTERPEMLHVVVEHPQLLQRYLGLPTDQRALLDDLRQEQPPYFEGQLGSQAPIPIRGWTPEPFLERTWELYKQIHVTKAVERLTQLWLKQDPQNRQPPLSLTAWFKSYDPLSGENLRGKKTSPGHRYYKRWQEYRKSGGRTSFETWITSQLTKATYSQVNEHPCLRPRDQPITIPQIVHAYITLKQIGPVPLASWFMSYDFITGENLHPSIRGKTEYHGASQGRRYHARWLRLTKKPEFLKSFDDWILDQIDPETREKLLQTPYFKNNSA